MSKVSLYETNWINLVFENRNKKYGAFQLRKESTQTSIFALFMGLLLCSFLMCIPRIISIITSQEQSPINPPEIIDDIIVIKNILPPKTLQTEKQAPPAVREQKPIEKIEKKQLVNPTIVPPTLATPDIEIDLKNNVIPDSTTDGPAIIGSNSSSGQGNGNGTGTGTGTETGTSYGNSIVGNEFLDKKPEFPGGIEKFYKYVGTRFVSPIIDDVKMVRIYVSFVVEKDGSMTDIKVLNNPGYGLEKEAIRVLKSLKTKWSPGMIGSKPVRTAFNLPITIQIN